MSRSPDMTCREFVEFLMAYLDQEVTPEQRAEFERHMDLCPPCVHYLDTYRETLRLERCLCAEPDGPVPEDVPDDLVRAVLRARRSG